MRQLLELNSLLVIQETLVFLDRHSMEEKKEKKKASIITLQVLCQTPKPALSKGPQSHLTAYPACVN